MYQETNRSYPLFEGKKVGLCVSEAMLPTVVDVVVCHSSSSVSCRDYRIVVLVGMRAGGDSNYKRLFSLSLVRCKRIRGPRRVMRRIDPLQSSHYLPELCSFRGWGYSGLDWFYIVRCQAGQVDVYPCLGTKHRVKQVIRWLGGTKYPLYNILTEAGLVSVR